MLEYAGKTGKLNRKHRDRKQNNNIQEKKLTKPVQDLQSTPENRSRMKKLLMAFGIVMIMFIVAYTSSVPGESGYEFNPDDFKTPKEISVEKSYSWDVVSAPKFASTDVTTGKTVSLNQQKGTLVLLNFVNYGCNPQINEIVSAQLLIVKELYEQRGDFEPISVFCGCCPESTLKNFASQNGLNWTWILDKDYSVIKLYSEYVSAYGYPTLVFVDENGDIQDATGYLEKSELAARIKQYN
jgi:peroxiredoxin